MQTDKKYARQLELSLGLKKGRKKEVAEKSFRTQPAISKYTKGIVNAPNDVKKVAVSVAHRLQLSFSSARSDFGVISFLQSNDLRTDMFAASNRQKKEERERLQIEQEAFEAMSKPAQKRSADDWMVIHQWCKEFSEEIGSEITELIQTGEYTGADIQEIINEYNEQYGG